MLKALIFLNKIIENSVHTYAYLPHLNEAFFTFCGFKLTFTCIITNFEYSTILHASKLQLYTCVATHLYTIVCRVFHIFGHFLSFLCSLWVDVSVDHSSDWVRGVYDGVRNLVCVVTVFIT